MTEIRPLYRQDLVNLANGLPKIKNIDHVKLVIDSYKEGQWKAVDKYCEFVYALHRELNPKESRRDFVTRKWIHYTTEARKCLTGLVNRLLDEKELILWAESPGMKVKVKRNRFQRWYLPKEFTTLSEQTHGR